MVLENSEPIKLLTVVWEKVDGDLGMKKLWVVKEAKNFTTEELEGNDRHKARQLLRKYINIFCNNSIYNDDAGPIRQAVEVFH